MIRKTHTEIEEKMKKTIAVFADELNTLRAGRANPTILDRVTVSYYGVETPLKQVSNVSAPEPRMILIQPWDVSLISEIEKGILKADLGLNPSNDGKLIRLIIPQLTEERRKELTKVLKKMTEGSKVAVRNERRTGLDKFKKMQKNGDITEDELKDAEKEMQKLTDKYVEEIDKMSKVKENELLEV